MFKNCIEYSFRKKIEILGETLMYTLDVEDCIEYSFRKKIEIIPLENRGKPGICVNCIEYSFRKKIEIKELGDITSIDSRL